MSLLKRYRHGLGIYPGISEGLLRPVNSVCFAARSWMTLFNFDSLHNLVSFLPGQAIGFQCAVNAMVLQSISCRFSPVQQRDIKLAENRLNNLINLGHFRVRQPVPPSSSYTQALD